MNVAKFLLVIFELFGWLAVIAGCLASFYGVFAEGNMTTAGLGLGITASGLLVCAVAQFMMATIVTAENTTEIKSLLAKLIDQNTRQDTQPKLSTGYPSKPIAR